MWRSDRGDVEPVVCPGELEVDVDGDAGVGLNDVRDVVDAAVNLDAQWRVWNKNYWVMEQPQSVVNGSGLYLCLVKNPGFGKD